MSRHAQHRSTRPGASRTRTGPSPTTRQARRAVGAGHGRSEPRRVVVARPGRVLASVVGVGLTLAVVAGLLPGGLASRLAAASPPEGQVLDTRTALPASEDVTITSLASANRGAETSLTVSRSGDRTLLKFATGDVEDVNEATLRVYAAQVGAPVDLRVAAAGAGWTERTVTAKDAPAVDPQAPKGDAVTVTSPGWVTLPLPALALTVPETTLELLSSGSTPVTLTSREGGKAAVLDVGWGGPRRPSPPTTTVTPPPTSSTTSTTTAPPTSSTTSTTAAPPATSPSPALPFDMAVDPGAGKKLAFAHYFTPYPVSMDNKAPADDYYTRNYLNPAGEKGIHSTYGGLLRDRPIGRSPAGGDWKLEDFKTEVRQARAAGLDGFTVDILNVRGDHWERIVGLLKAADAVDPDFQIVLQPDMTTLNDESSETIAAAMDQLATYPAAARLPDGRLVISPFAAENQSVTWWTSWLATMKNQKGEQVAFVPVFLNWRSSMDPFAPISHGFSAWGDRSPQQVGAVTQAADKAHAMGKIWMSPVAVQDVRPNQSTYWEAGNTETLRASWKAAIDGKADWVHIPTWNDYSENTAIAPSANHGWAFLDASAYWLTTWKTGAAPAVVRDAVYVSSRTQFAATKPTFAQSKLMTLRGGSTPTRDTVEALVFLKSPATVTVTVGTTNHVWSAPAGVSAKTFPLGTGTVKAAIARGGTALGQAVLSEPVTTTPHNQDLSYYAAGSLRK